MDKALLMGNEAIALGALRAGLRLASGYPGTPSTEILEALAKELKAGRAPDLYVEWSVNEKTALEVAAGAAWSGLRAMVTMKQVGLNVASDPLMSLNYLGVEGGLVVVVADDPGPISSQTEQDTRHFGRYAKIAVFDPSSPEEAYAMTGRAFEFSEKYHRPVILRPTTRVCHSYAAVKLLPPMEKSRSVAGFQKADNRFVIFPSLAYRNHVQIEKDLAAMAGDLSSFEFECRRINGVGSRRGIASGGISWAYTMEALERLEAANLETSIGRETEFHADRAASDVRCCKVAALPVSEKTVFDFLKGLDEVLVIEELDPVIETELLRICAANSLSVKIKGKLNGHMPNAGEYSVALVTEKLQCFLGLHSSTRQSAALALQALLPVRPPVLCAGCPHRASFFAVKEAVRKYNAGRAVKRKAVYSGDIGCYTLGNALPLDMVDTCLCMGAGISNAQGINRAEILLGHEAPLNFAFIGDSTFFHTGIPGIINAVYSRANIIIVVLDNSTTAMTGGQPHPGMRLSISGSPAEKISIVRVLESLGITEIVRVNPFDQEEARNAVAGMLGKDGVRVIVFEAPCIMVGRPGMPLSIDAEKCSSCKLCVSTLGCPAISCDRSPLSIDRSLCTGCGLCKSVCPSLAIGAAS
ncbi:MAG: indolepyruvate ferredoxin oxidoreductase subunit alpha [Treponema sp.]|jgi:indolepyruvate ferredoxin oxidoreductase alpha subunit|nr:indolepyruvate ferredoxin oxidoreductase subunit alpha [Treponema sp.]